jgi:hypothetical protein
VDDPGVAHEDLDRAERRLDLVEGRPPSPFGPDVELDRDAADLRGNRLRPGQVDVRDRDPAPAPLPRRCRSPRP